MRLALAIIAAAAALTSCDRQQRYDAGREAADAAKVVADRLVGEPLQNMTECMNRRQPPRVVFEQVTVPPKSARECYEENGKIINEAVMQCRRGYTKQVKHEVAYVADPAIKCRD